MKREREKERSRMSRERMRKEKKKNARKSHIKRRRKQTGSMPLFVKARIMKATYLNKKNPKKT
jgi:hypothetical protein